MTNSELQATIVKILQYRAAYVTGWLDAFCFSCSRKEKQEDEKTFFYRHPKPQVEIQAKIQETLFKFMHQIPPDTLRDTMVEPVQAYYAGYLACLDHFIALTVLEERIVDLTPNKIARTLSSKGFTLDGRSVALAFAVNCQGDVVRLEAEIRKTENMIADLVAKERRRMYPGASPRIFQDGYIAGLNEAVEIVKSIKQLSEEK